jgi:hypothetical protein
LNQSVVVALGLDLMRLRKTSMIVETIEPVFRHRRSPLRDRFYDDPEGKAKQHKLIAARQSLATNCAFQRHGSRNDRRQRLSQKSALRALFPLTTFNFKWAWNKSSANECLSKYIKLLASPSVHPYYSSEQRYAANRRRSSWLLSYYDESNALRTNQRPSSDCRGLGALINHKPRPAGAANSHRTYNDHNGAAGGRSFDEHSGPSFPRHANISKFDGQERGGSRSA